MPRSDRAAYLMLVGMAISFGGTWVAADVAVEAAPPFTIAALRFGIASVLLYAWSRLAGRRLTPIRRADLPLIAGLALTAVAGYNWLFLTGLTLAPASDGAIIVPGLAPVFTALLAGATLGERLGPRVFAGLAIAAAGLYLVVMPGGGTSETRLLGDALFLAGAALWGVYSVLARIASRRFDAVSTTLYGIALGTVILVPAALLEGGAERVLDAPIGALAGIGYLAVFGTVAAFVLLNLGVARLGAARASAFALLVPVIGVLSSVWLLGDPIGPNTVIGGAIVLVGLWLVEHPGSAPTRPAAVQAGVPAEGR
ncbi:MAG TPA: DMT family transporter [Candidatus Limnocylindria bacterium]|nr:DMT family transporter [Candidatus Limnocylindria bacterium]